MRGRADSAEEVQWFVRMFLDMQAERPRTKFQLAITLPESGRLIGNCGVRKASADATEADIGYELAPDVWGNGYATEAARAIVCVRVSRSWACTASRRAASRTTWRRRACWSGWVCSGRGVCARVAHYKGRWWDELVYGLLEDEWATGEG